MNEFIFLFNSVVISGAVIGAIYAMGAIGVTLIFSILRFAHFAHADLMTTGAFVTFFLTVMFPGVGPAVGLPTAFVMLPIAMVLTSLIAVGIDKAFYKPLREHNVKPIVLVMASLGVTFMLQGLVRLFAGTGSRNLFVDDRKEIFRIDLPWELASRKIVITEPQLLLFLFTIIAVVSLHYFLTRSRLGKAMRAMSDNADLARVSGINVNVVVIVTWVIAGSLCAAAGTLLSLDVALKPDLSFNLLLPIFAAAIVGGVGHVYGAVLGGFVVGFAESLAVFNWAVVLRPLARAMEWDLPRSMALVPTEYKITVPFFILIAILVLRPTGILKGKVI
ncbi:branched-chain amino acid ABC transporter permease [Reinekea blandensis]|uniref:Branched-chain amino acid ABC transporter, permease protein n=1 Tax=Reinekea blandensis MED297 TaxID=314283 RepID=A4BKM1_9GAMM|nr:branched-chain amino acid ABC transporter permease [Reinekea blandensis]EAR07332.1 branched-chain amino acid ABC transporter, permease protein [Reinekea sp. MED297] [Reinekea blandensis MED297]